MKWFNREEKAVDKFVIDENGTPLWNYAAVAYQYVPQRINSHLMNGLVNAWTREEAEGEVWRRLMVDCPVGNGYSGHHILVAQLVAKNESSG